MPLIVRLTRDVGQQKAGEVLRKDKSTATWLVERGYAERVQQDMPETPAQPPEPEPETEQGPADDVDLSVMSLKELRDRATSLALPTYGTKAQIIERIERYGA